MANLQRNSLGDRDAEQAFTALKKGAYLLKYGRRGKPKFCPFRLSNDETVLIWYAGKEEKQLRLSHVSRIVPGQRTAIFQRYPRPEKEYQSFSLIYGKRSLDLPADEPATPQLPDDKNQKKICKDKDEAEIWFVALRTLVSHGNCQSWTSEVRRDSVSSDSSSAITQRNSLSIVSSSSSDILYKDPRSTPSILIPFKSPPQKRLGRAFSDVVPYDAAAQSYPQTEWVANSFSSDNLNGRRSSDTFRTSFSSAVSSSSQGSSLEDFDALGDVFIWGEGICNGLLGGNAHRVGKNVFTPKMDALLPKALESTVLLDAQNIAFGSKHAVLVTKQGEIFSWGEGSGGRLGHGVETDVSNPYLVKALSGFNTESIACGDYHTCAVTVSGDLYTWGDGAHNFGLLGHGSEVSHWTPRKVSGPIEGLHISSISCGLWHTAAITSVGQLFTFGDGTFGALGHGDHCSSSVPREVEILIGLRTVMVCCGFWHTAAVVELTTEDSTSSSSIGKLFTWGDGEKGQLGHGDNEPKLVPSSVEILGDVNFCQVGCGQSVTIALTTLGQVYTMGSSDFGQLGNPGSACKLPSCIEGNISSIFIAEIACGSHHVAVLSSKSEVYTWGKGANGQLGHGDNGDRNTPTLVEALKNKRVKTVVCGSNFTAAICLHKWVCSADSSNCSGCHNPFNFRRKRHNCYNCGLIFCKECSSRKSLKASLAPNMNKPYRVCDDCFNKLKKPMESALVYKFPVATNREIHRSSGEVKEREILHKRSHSLLSKLSSFDSFRRPDNRCPKQNRKLESNSDHINPIDKGSFQRASSCIPNSTTTISEDPEKISACPGSKTNFQAASLVSVKSDPSHSRFLTPDFAVLQYPEVPVDDSKKTNKSLTSEISILRAQEQDLSHKSQLLEVEVERTSRQLKEATDLAMKEAEKNKAAKEVIKSLTWQLKGMAERVSEGAFIFIKPDPFAAKISSTEHSLSLEPSDQLDV